MKYEYRIGSECPRLFVGRVYEKEECGISK
jgi:hypothetical protein